MKSNLFVVVLVGVLFFSGCVEEQPPASLPECNEPYIRDGSDCCLDENADGVCDDQQIKPSITLPSKIDEPVEVKPAFRLTNPPLDCDSKSRSVKNDLDYLILVPKMMFAGAESSVTMASTDKDSQAPAKACIEYSLKDERNNRDVKLVEASTGDEGHSVASFIVPNVESGVYKIIANVIGTSQTFNGSVTIKQNPALFVETDKPIYKPGQLIQGRVLTLDNNLKPMSLNLIVEILDAKGIKIFKKNITSNDFGVATFELPLAIDLNFGTWKIYSESGSSKTNIDILVEKYVLPKFKVTIDLPREWFLVGEKITGKVSADYFFGKNVEGEVKIDTYKYVGEWIKYTTYTADLENGSTEFTLPPAEYVAGTVGAGGQGSLLLNISVTDTGGHTEETSKLLKITQSSTVLQLILESRAVKPTIPFEILVVTETPDGEPLSEKVIVDVNYKDIDFDSIESEKLTLQTRNGLAVASFTPPEDTYAVEVNARLSKDKDTKVELALQSVYSPTSNFIHLIQQTKGTPKVGDVITFKVYATQGGRIYYDVVSSGRTVYSSSTQFFRNNSEMTIEIPITFQMSPESKLVAYKINPNSEVSVDTLPFDVGPSFPVELEAEFSEDEASPGDSININFDAEGKSMIGVSIVDESVYALSEGRLNIRQVFDELEKRFMEPQAEAHPVYTSIYDFSQTVTPIDMLKETGMQALGSKTLKFPEPKKPDRVSLIRRGRGVWFEGLAVGAGVTASVSEPRVEQEGEPLAEVSRVRQFFPETWLWNPELLTDNSGKAELTLTVPDSITTWKLHAISSSVKGLGLVETDLTVFQDFFVESDLPYAVTRGEEFPVSVLVYNYLDTPQNVYLELDKEDWFDLLGESKTDVEVEGNSVSSVSFTIRPKKLGVKTVDVTARTTKRADAVKREIIVEPEGVQREFVENGILKADKDVTIDAQLPDAIIQDSGKLLFSLTPSIVAQSINGVDDLLAMPMGCGEQNMMLFAPDVEVMRYLEATKQVNPEVQAKVEVFMQTGYQRELTYRHGDGSYSAFGERDESGSLWLTNFVLWEFASARDLIEIDDNILSTAAAWIQGHQKKDGSWDHVGFLVHKEMSGSLSGTYSLTAYIVLGLDEYGNANADVMNKAKKYLEDNLDSVEDDAYSLAIGSLTLQKLESDKADEAIVALLDLAKEDDNGMYWGEDPIILRQQYGRIMLPPPTPPGKSVETTAYAALSLIEANRAEANKVMKWIVSQRNSKGGFRSTQDTVIAFKALVAAASGQRKNIDATVTLTADGKKVNDFELNPENFDVLQIQELPSTTENIRVYLKGKGDVNYQLVTKFNIAPPNITERKEIELEVDYDSKNVIVNDIVNVHVKVKYVGRGNSSGMMIVDVAVPTGFVHVQDSLDKLIEEEDLIPKIEVGGRKIIVYVDDLVRDQELEFDLQVKARFPVKAIIPASKAYSYYRPETKTEIEGGRITAK
ncbi:MAG: alpha-2-macroglobulin family protein [Candidatus Altiarchaeota archaeon]